MNSDAAGERLKVSYCERVAADEFARAQECCREHVENVLVLARPCCIVQRGSRPMQRHALARGESECVEMQFVLSISALRARRDCCTVCTYAS